MNYQGFNKLGETGGEPTSTSLEKTMDKVAYEILGLPVPEAQAPEPDAFENEYYYDEFEQDSSFFGSGRLFDIFSVIVMIFAVIMAIKLYFWGNPTEGQKLAFEVMAGAASIYSLHLFAKYCFRNTSLPNN